MGRIEEGIVYNTRHNHLSVLYRVVGSYNCNVAFRYLPKPGLGLGFPQRLQTLPGAGASPAVIWYDQSQELYLMVGTVLTHGSAPTQYFRGSPQAHTQGFHRCRIDRAALGLFYSANGADWVLDRLLLWSKHMHEHYAYPSVGFHPQFETLYNAFIWTLHWCAPRQT